MDHTQVPADQSAFPLLVEVADVGLSGHAQPDGDDFLFTAADGLTQLSHEIESYDSATGQLLAWVNVPLLSSSVDTVLYLYYGNALAESQADPAGVWDSGYLAVHHLEETAGLVTDSTANGNDGQLSSGDFWLRPSTAAIIDDDATTGTG